MATARRSSGRASQASRRKTGGPRGKPKGARPKPKGARVKPKGAHVKSTGKRVKPGSRRSKAPARKVRKKVAGRRPELPTARKRARPTARKRTKAPARKTTGRRAPAHKTAVRKVAPRRARAGTAAQSRPLEQRIADLETALLRARGEKEEALLQHREALARLQELEARLKAIPDAKAQSSVSLGEPSLPADDDVEAGAPPAAGAGDDILEDEETLEDDRPFDNGLAYDDYDEEEESVRDPSAGMAERRRELDRERAGRELELGDAEYWLVCPKCGEHLTEHEFDNIKVERCESCGLISVDKGEIELLMVSEDKRLIAYRVKGLMQ